MEKCSLRDGNEPIDSIPLSGSNTHVSKCDNEKQPTYTMPGVVSYLQGRCLDFEKFNQARCLNEAELHCRIIYLEGIVDMLSNRNRLLLEKLETIEGKADPKKEPKPHKVDSDIKLNTGRYFDAVPTLCEEEDKQSRGKGIKTFFEKYKARIDSMSVIVDNYIKFVEGSSTNNLVSFFRPLPTEENVNFENEANMNSDTFRKPNPASPFTQAVVDDLMIKFRRFLDLKARGCTDEEARKLVTSNSRKTSLNAPRIDDPKYTEASERINLLVKSLDQVDSTKTDHQDNASWRTSNSSQPRNYTKDDDGLSYKSSPFQVPKKKVSVSSSECTIDQTAYTEMDEFTTSPDHGGVKSDHGKHDDDDSNQPVEATFEDTTSVEDDIVVPRNTSEDDGDDDDDHHHHQDQDDKEPPRYLSRARSNTFYNYTPARVSIKCRYNITTSFQKVVEVLIFHPLKPEYVTISGDSCLKIYALPPPYAPVNTTLEDSKVGVPDDDFRYPISTLKFPCTLFDCIFTSNMHHIIVLTVSGVLIVLDYDAILNDRSSQLEFDGSYQSPFIKQVHNLGEPVSIRPCISDTRQHALFVAMNGVCHTFDLINLCFISKQPQLKISGYLPDLLSVSFIPLSETLLLAAFATRLIKYDTDDPNYKQVLLDESLLKGDKISAILIGSDGFSIVVGMASGKLLSYDLNGEKESLYYSFDRHIQSIALHSSSDYLLIGFWEGPPCVFALNEKCAVDLVDPQNRFKSTTSYVDDDDQGTTGADSSDSCGGDNATMSVLATHNFLDICAIYEGDTEIFLYSITEVSP